MKGHVATEPLRTATKTTNLRLSAQPRIGAIEYDSYRHPRRTAEVARDHTDPGSDSPCLPPSVSEVINGVAAVSSTQEIGAVQCCRCLQVAEARGDGGSK
ncbi:unnamed protein product [Pleuronectes platessa]|uniref:Uncharacterized protein n=1 Tax=Pleuronectes platessa TaxID=8262 RepID=A0A9N7TW76_PLEPL|nr:unnamed protein product [Pleuronectes platessa]